jgi:hypothetical protein
LLHSAHREWNFKWIFILAFSSQRLEICSGAYQHNILYATSK